MIQRSASKVISWLARMLSEGDGTPSTKRVCFFGAVIVCASLCIGLFLRHGVEALAVDLAKAMLVSAGAAYAITRWSEYGNGPTPPPPPQ